jgi:hypothetical protein
MQRCTQTPKIRMGRFTSHDDDVWSPSCLTLPSVFLSIDLLLSPASPSTESTVFQFSDVVSS